MATQKTQNLPPIWERSSVKPVKLHVHLNGEQYVQAKDVTLNKKVTNDFDKWLDSMTVLLRPREGALRCAFTPQHGHRVRSLDGLKDGDRIVVGCRDAFQRLSYETIQGPRRGHHNSRQNVWVGHNSRIQVSAQYKKVDTHGTRIMCWQNNSTLHGARPVVLPPLGSHQLTMTYVLDRINEKMSKTSGGVINKLYTQEGEEITRVDQLQSHCCYVAVCSFDSFKKADYPEKSLPHFITSPRPDRRGYRRERAKKEKDGPFHHKPVKHKRSSEKARQTDYDQDNGGVFKARSQNRATKGAREVEDSGQTKTEVPVDQRPTEEVQEDIKGNGKKDKKGNKQQDDGGPPSNWQSQQDQQRVEKQQLERRRQRKREEEEKRQEEAQRRREEVERERKREEEEERQWREEKGRKTAQDSRPDGQDAGGRGRGASPYRSGTDMLGDRDSQPPQTSDWDPAPASQQAGGQGDDSRYEGEGERVRAATTIQAHYRGMKARQEVKAMRAQREG